MKTKIVLLIIASISLLCNCQRKAGNEEFIEPEIFHTPATVATKTIKSEDLHTQRASLSVWRYHRAEGPIVLKIRYINNTINKYKYVSFLGSPYSSHFKALLKMPDATIREVQIRSGDEYLNGSFAQYTEINPGYEIEWLYVLTLAPLDVSGRFLHPGHWSFGPGKYEVSVSSRTPEIVFSRTVIPKIYTPVVSFEVGKGANKLRGVREIKPDWGRGDAFLDICVQGERYGRLFSDLESSSKEQRGRAAYTLSSMTQIDVADHEKAIKLWNKYVAKYQESTFSPDRDETMYMIGCLSKMLRKMNTKEAKELLDKRTEDLKKATPFIGG